MSSAGPQVAFTLVISNVTKEMDLANSSMRITKFRKVNGMMTNSSANSKERWDCLPRQCPFKKKMLILTEIIYRKLEVEDSLFKKN